jgi:hypothetical protein
LGLYNYRRVESPAEISLSRNRLIRQDQQLLMNRETLILIRANLDGLTCVGLFRKLKYPGAPAGFVDPRSAEEVIATGEVGGEIAAWQERADRQLPL